ncbi:MAG: putative toxin-antitoxin system toxin component, PIN family [Ignavibacteria bacterium GWF2_33_9]|nr:MAG: putative toxin-antitoxin system toxin component, PIN family [Ignavibacteria bacterium GWF2_33_9]
MKSKRIILDTNLWISFLITQDFDFLDNLIVSGKIKLIFSKELIEEFISVASRPKFKKYFSLNEIEEILALFDSYGEIVEVWTNINLCRDPKDNFLLNLAIDSKAPYLITGDSDLLEIKEIEGTKIITYNELIKILT